MIVPSKLKSVGFAAENGRFFCGGADHGPFHVSNGVGVGMYINME